MWHVTERDFVNLVYIFFFTLGDIFVGRKELQSSVLNPSPWGSKLPSSSSELGKTKSVMVHPIPLVDFYRILSLLDY